jgi:GntR family transcriptional regulator/MocR family aminotransferase
MLIPLDTTSARPLYLQIAEFLTALAVSGQLRAGDRLPSTRQLAEQLGVHRSTAVTAYEELLARGVIVAQQGSGTYVAAGLSVTQTAAPRDVAPVNVSRDALLSEMWRLNQQADLVSLALGIPGDDLIPLDLFERRRQTVLRRDGERGWSYLPPEGHERLRAAIARDLARHGLQVDGEDVIVTNGAQEALALIARALAQPGDPVLSEAPSFFTPLLNWEHAGLHIHGVPLGPHGLALAAVDARGTLGGHPRLMLVTPDHHNPTGLCWPAEARHAFLKWAAERALTVVEDATYRDLRLEGPELPPLAALDREVLYVGAFSKSLIPGIRVGFVVARGPLREQLITLKQLTTGSGESYGQRALAEFLLADDYAPHLERVTRLYRQRRDALLEALLPTLPDGTRWRTPQGGFYVWLELPPEIDANAIFRRALERGLVLFPASPFYPASTPPANALRLCFARYPEPVLAQAARRVF